MLEVEVIMVALMLLAALRAHDQFDSSKPLAWPLLIGFVVLFLASIALWSRRRQDHAEAGHRQPQQHLAGSE
jgi:sensor domain CHASE-containing protein